MCIYIYFYICKEVGVTLTILPYLTFWSYVERIACKGLNVNLKYECPFPQFPVPYVFRPCCSQFPVYQVTSPYSSNIGYNIYCRKLRGGYQLRKEVVLLNHLIFLVAQKSAFGEHIHVFASGRETVRVKKHMFKLLRNALLGTYFTHVQTCNGTRVQSATEWTASVHALHMSKPVM